MWNRKIPEDQNDLMRERHEDSLNWVTTGLGIQEEESESDRTSVSISNRALIEMSL